MSIPYSSLPEDRIRLVDRSPSPAIPAINPQQDDLHPLPTIRRWPNQPQRLSRGREVTCFGDIIALIVSLGFIIVAVIVASTNRKPAMEIEKNGLKTVLKWSTTIFPLVFSAVVGRTIKTLAAWKLHLGITLGLLEQLMGSTTVFGTLVTQAQLGINRIGIGLVALWILSPIGSHSSQPALTTVLQNVSSSVGATYLDTRQASKFGVSGTPEALQTPLNAIYLAALMSSEPTKNSSMDLWGNVKIPAYKQLAASLPEASSGWISVPQGAVSYSSLLGIPALNISTTGNTTFAVETTYLDLDCYNISRSAPFPIENRVNETFWSTDMPGNPFSIALDGFVLEDPSTLGPFNSSIENIPNDTDVSGFHHTLLFQSSIYSVGSAPQNTTVAFCTLTQQYIESNVTCSGAFCRVTDIRQSLRTHAPSNITTLSFPFLFQQFSLYFPTATGSVKDSQVNSTATECYIAHPASPFCPAAAGSTFGAVDLSATPKDLFELRLGKLLNTYYQGSLQPFSMTGAFATNPATNISVPASLSFLQERYTVHWLYLGLYAFSAFALLLAAAVGAWFNWQIPGRMCWAIARV
ncbi:hypothetical protein K432DRAFT_393328 [Lepidopterella palustris CBS 459.81]|uniref:Uncharacterized protein n=1 Tax=Lepidopterella palustris CBS 459.81 TaxID=1314670 RepID=A0A8E2EA18_9PEZI|nr:hypothetical protein K432DRAFT_393328 [Lepidopterella palustris CBS 459.81]